MPWSSSTKTAPGTIRYSRGSGEVRWDVTAMGYYGLWNATDQIPLRAVAAGEIDRFGAVDPTGGGKTYRFSVSGAYQQDIGGGVFRASAYAVRYRLDLFSDFTYFLDDPLNSDQIEQLDDRWMLGTSGNYAWTASAGGVPVEVTAGWEARHDRIDPIGLYHTAGRQRLSTVRQDFARETSAGLFAEGAVTLMPWLRAVAGVRYDEYFFDVISDDPSNSGREAAGRFSPKLSAVFGPWARTELFANFGLGFHSNDARGVTTTVDPQSGAPVSNVTPLAGTRGGEIGVPTVLVPQVLASLALWRLDLDSELLFTGDAGTTEPSRASRRQGIELSARWHPIRWLLFDLDFAWSRARFTSPDPDPAVKGDFIPGAIESAVSAGISLHELGPWSASVFVRYFGPRPLVEDDSVRSTSSALVNAQVTFRLTRWAKLTLDVFNLFDQQADDIAYFYRSRLRGEPVAGVGGIHFHPAEKRSLRLAGALTF